MEVCSLRGWVEFAVVAVYCRCIVRLTILSAVADRLIKSAVMERFVQPRMVDSLNVVGFVQAAPTCFRDSAVVADGFEGQAATFLSGDSIN